LERQFVQELQIGGTSMSEDAHSDLTALGEAWIAAWNSRDLARILALYADDAEMTSDGIVRLGFAVQGSVRGKQNLRAYWSKALAMFPSLHFTPTGVFTSPNSLIVHYTTDRGQTICEYLRVDQVGRNAGLIVQGSAHHLAQTA
jgi:ketosteroid isomerase-like protein